MHDKDGRIWEDLKCENNAIWSEGTFGKHRIKRLLSNLNLDECIGSIGLNGCCRI